MSLPCRPCLADVHLSPHGNDANPGTLQAPFATFDRARTAVLETKQPAAHQPTTIWLHEGVYRFNAPVELARADSGTSSAPLVIAAWPGERVVLSGSSRLPLTAFTKLDSPQVRQRIIDQSARDKVLQIDLPKAGINDTGILSRHGFGAYHRLAKMPPVYLYIDGQRQSLARWPNPDESFPDLLSKLNKSRAGVVARSRVIDPGPKDGDPDFERRGGTFEIAFDRPKHWMQAEDIWLEGIFAKSWEWSYNRVAKLDPSNHSITLAYGEMAGLPVKPEWTGDFFYAENLLEEIDRPGEYYIDRSTNILYLYPPKAFPDKIELATIAAPLFRLQNVSHVVFRDLVFENGRDFALTVQGGDHVRIERCEFRNFANGGVRLQGRNHGVTGSHLHDIGRPAIVLNCGDKETLEPGGCFVEDNHIHDWGWYQKVFAGAVNVDGVGQKITHNHIYNAPHGAIYLRGNNHLVSHNDFHDLLNTFIDMGAIYGAAGDSPLERGHVIRRNYFHDFGRVLPGQHAVYPDNLVMGWTIEENLFARIGNPGIPAPGNHGVHLNSTAHVEVRRNLFLDCMQPLVLGDYAARVLYPKFLPAWKREVTPERLAKLPHLQAYPELSSFWEENRRAPDSNRYENNLIWNPERPLVDYSQPGKSAFIDGALDQLGTLKRNRNFIARSNPGFSNPNAGNFRFNPSAELLLYLPDFPAFDTGEFGPRPENDSCPLCPLPKPTGRSP